MSWHDIIVFLAAAVAGGCAWYVRRSTNGADAPTPPVQASPSLEAMWTEILEIRATQTKILEGMNKWLRKHGRTLQASAQLDADEAALPRKRAGGMILRHGNKRFD